jgi:isocitrate dehydrogenase (NAD+)
MLEHLGEREAATRIDTAITRVLKEKKRVTRDLGGSARTLDMAKAIVEALG